MHALVKTAAVAVLGVLAWKAWQRRRAAPVTGMRDDGDVTSAHGDPRVPAVEESADFVPRAAAHSSRGFGGP